MAKKIYLICEASKEEYKKAAVKYQVKNKQMDCWVESIAMHACESKKEAIRDCRIFNDRCETAIHYTQEINLY